MKLALLIGTLIISQMTFAQDRSGRNYQNTQVNLASGQSIELMPYQRTTVSCDGDYGSPSEPLNACKMAGAGAFGGFTYNYRISQNGKAIHGTDNLEASLTQFKAMVDNGVCTTVRGSCTMAGPGAFGGFTYNYRIAFDGVAVHGTDNNSTSLAVFQKLKAAGICR